MSTLRIEDRNLALEAVRVTERAAIASSAWLGRGDEHAADQAAVDAMRQALNVLDIDGTVVIGEGERDEAPMLYIGERVGSGNGPKVDIALDPLEGTTITATGGPNAIACLAMAGEGGFLNAPDTYMDKIAVGGGLPEGVIDINASPRENLANLARAKDVEIGSLVALILDRPRHQELIAKVREAGCRIRLIRDGDVAGVIATARPDSGVDIYLGIGGAPEGVLAAAALRSIGGQLQGRLHFRNDDERARARAMGITDLDRVYGLHDLASGDVMFAATGVTDGTMLSGVRSFPGGVITHSIVMRSKTGTVRLIETEHYLRRKVAVVPDWLEPTPSPLPRHPPAPPPSPDVRFTIYHPAQVSPRSWATMLVYTHLPEMNEWVGRDALSHLGRPERHAVRTGRATRSIARGAEIVVAPELPGCRFNPPADRFLWLEDAHRREFRLQADPGMPGFTPGAAVNGRVAFYVESILVAEVAIWTFVADQAAGALKGLPQPMPVTATAGPYSAIFVSYAHEDSAVVAHLRPAYRALGMSFLRDQEVLRSGEKWNRRLLDLIEQADIFQLYWSDIARRSRYVRKEWRHALQQERDNFIRPVYWQKPLPKPPGELKDLQFAYLED